MRRAERERRTLCSVRAPAKPVMNAYEEQRTEQNLVDTLRSPALLAMHATAHDVSAGVCVCLRPRGPC